MVKAFGRREMQIVGHIGCGAEGICLAGGGLAKPAVMQEGMAVLAVVKAGSPMGRQVEMVTSFSRSAAV